MATFYNEGRYLCQVTEQALGKSSNKGTPQFVLKFRVMECITPREDVTQYERTAYLYITEKTVEHLTPKLQALGYTRDSFKYLSPTEPNYHSFVGQEVEMYCKHEAGLDGMPKERWDIANSGGSKPLDVTPIDAKEIRQLDMLFGKQLKALKSNGHSKPVTALGPTQCSDGGPSDDEIPF